MSARPRSFRGLGRNTTLLLTLAGVGFGSLPHAEARPTGNVPLLPLFDGESEKAAGELGSVFIHAVAKMLEEYPSGKKSARENAYSALIAVWIATCVSGTGDIVGLTTLGTGLGGALGGAGGALVGSLVPGLGTASVGVAGAGVGGVAGGGTGAIVGFNVAGIKFLATALITTLAVDYIEGKYPQTAALHLDREPPSTMMGYMPSSTRGAWASAADPYAGVSESMFVHIVDTTFSDSMLDLADKWTSMPGLTEDQKSKLRTFDHLRPAFEKIAYIKRNKKVSSRAKPAMPLGQWAKTAQGLLHGDEAAIQNAWLAALGVGDVGFNVSNGELQIKPGNALKDAGTPDMIKVGLPTLTGSVSVGPAKGSVSLKPGSFSARVSKAKLITSGADAGRIQVKLTIDKGSRLATGSASYEVPGTKGSVDISLSAAQTVDVEVLFRLESYKLVVDKVSINGLSADVGVGSLPGPVSALLGPMKDKAKGEVARVLDEGKLKTAFEDLAKHSVLVLGKTADKMAASAGMVDIEKIEKLRVEGGKVLLDVRGKRIEWPFVPDTQAALAALKKAQAPAAPKAMGQLPAMPGKVMPGKAMPKG